MILGRFSLYIFAYIFMYFQIMPDLPNTSRPISASLLANERYFDTESIYSDYPHLAYVQSPSPPSSVHTDHSVSDGDRAEVSPPCRIALPRYIIIPYSFVFLLFSSLSFVGSH